jgi:hypothetical protein
MANRQDYIGEVKKLVPGDNHPIGEPEIIKAIAKAIKTYSKHRPREVVEDIAGDGGFEYDLGDLDHWSDEFSIVKTVEYPVDDTDENPDLLLDDEVEIYKKPAGTYLRFLDDTPAATEQIRITYTGMHVCTDEECTVPDADEEAVQALAAAYFCKMLAAAYATDEDSTINADSVNHAGKSERYLRMKKEYQAEYDEHIGIKEGNAAAFVTAAAPATDRTRLSH